MPWLFKPSKLPDMEAEKSTESTIQVENLRDKVVTAIKQVYDPEIPVDVYELGLIYEITVYPVNNVYVQMTLTSPNCPSAEFIPSEVKEKIQQITGVNNVEVEVTFDPPYSQDMMSEVAKLELGFL
jgi:FeS assembly SUF system protein